MIEGQKAEADRLRKAGQLGAVGVLPDRSEATEADSEVRESVDDGLHRCWHVGADSARPAANRCEKPWRPWSRPRRRFSPVRVLFDESAATSSMAKWFRARDGD